MAGSFLPSRFQLNFHLFTEVFPNQLIENSTPIALSYHLDLFSLLPLPLSKIIFFLIYYLSASRKEIP